MMGKPKRKTPPGRPTHRWVNNVLVDLSENRCDGLDWIDLTQDRDQQRALVKIVINL
jgi:hypothetical protein